MAAGTLNCPMCGAPASTDTTCCSHCGARLATVACPSCFGMIFVGAKFCSHCGARYGRVGEAASTYQCPRCAEPMNIVTIGKAELCECPKCQGMWAETAAVQRICDDREQEVLSLGRATQATGQRAVEIERKIRYLPCPVCSKLMNRVNFARCSSVVVDVCKPHGTWFDRDELRRVVEFVRAGGLDAARAREIAELEERRNRLNSDEHESRPFSRPDFPLQTERWDDGISALAAAIRRFLK